MIVAMSASQWLKVRPLITPIALLITSGMLAYAATWFADGVANSLTKIIPFAAVAILTLHVTFYVFRWATDDVSLKLVDYIYLIIALGSIGAVIDLQATGMKYEAYDFMPESIAKLERLSKECADSPTTNVFTVGCKWQGEIMRYVRGGAYDHMIVGIRIESFERNKEELAPLHGDFFAELKSLWENVEALRKEYGVPHDREMLWWKLYFMYMFCVGAVVRLCKVTVELFEWRVKKVDPLIEIRKNVANLDRTVRIMRRGKSRPTVRL